MEQIIIIIHVIVAVCVVGLVLVQHGKGADVGASFGSGSSNTMFGSQGAMSFMMKITGLLAAIFFATNLSLSYMVGHRSKSRIMPASKSAPALTIPAADKNGKQQQKKQQQIVFPSIKNITQGSGTGTSKGKQQQ